MRSVDNGSRLSFVHVSPFGLTNSLIGGGEAHLKSRKCSEHLVRLVVTRRSRVSFVFPKNERRFYSKKLSLALTGRPVGEPVDRLSFWETGRPVWNRSTGCVRIWISGNFC